MGLRIAIIILWLTSSVFAVTKTKTVIEGGGGDYTSLETCLNANESDITAGVGTVFVASIEGAWTGADENAVTIDGWTTSSDYDITVVTDTDARHDGKWKSTAYVLDVGSGTALGFQEDYVHIEGLQIDNTGGDVCIYISPNIGVSSISYCIVQGGASNLRINGTGAATVYIFNTICYDAATYEGIQSNDGSVVGVYVENVTIHNAARYGIAAFNSATTIAVNAVVQDCGNDAYTGDFTSSSYNCSDDNTQPGTNGQNGEVTFENEGADDFHLGAGDTVAKDNGTDGVNSGHTDDIDNDSRPVGVSWDMGADEEETGAAPAATPRRLELLRGK